MQRGDLHEATRIMPSQVCYRANPVVGSQTFAIKAHPADYPPSRSIDVNCTQARERDRPPVNR
jgi:hypothetical protein